MDNTTEGLQAAIERLDAGALDARLWIDEVRAHAVSVANQSDSLIGASRRARLMARRLAAGAGRNNCVGVFGPSQAGKSYLVSALARPRDGRLRIVLGDAKKDFLKEVNPPGDRESTGLVTRFTIRRQPVDPTHPAELSLLTETDLVKVLGNSHLNDFDPNNMKVPTPGEDDVRAAIAAAEAQAGSVTARHLDEIALFDLGEYFQTNFPRRVEALTRAGYWEALIDLGGRLRLADRAPLFAMLWGQLPSFTELFVHLVEALEKVGHARDAHAGMEGLEPRLLEATNEPNSIIDVGVLARLRTARDEVDLIPVVPVDGSAKGQHATLPRATLTALIAEIRLVVEQQPWPFFAHTDLLDFPGARSRLKLQAMPDDPEEADKQLRELFLRGKIAYLFQRYTDALELTSMLLCMPPSVNEVKDLAPMVRGWIDRTHGDTPDQRKAVKNALFLVLTMHDIEFTEKDGDTKESRRGKWDRRLHSSLFELYGRDQWPENWDGRPFNNTVFLRNPGVQQLHLMAYADLATLQEYADLATLQEEGKATADGAGELIKSLRDAFMTSSVVDAHFAQKKEVWEAALTPNDGGVEFLVGRLTAVLDPNLKRSQASERLREVAATLSQLLRSFYHGEGDTARQEKDEAIQALRRSLHQNLIAGDFRGFAYLLSAMMLREGDLRAVFENVAALKEDELAGDRPAEPAVDVDPWANDPWSSGESATVAKAPEVHRLERPEVFARRVMNEWAKHLRALQQNPRALQAIGVSSDLVGGLVDEFLIAAERDGVAERIARDVRRETVSAGARWGEIADRAVRIAHFHLNDFVAFMGYAGLPPTERPAFPEPPKAAQRTIFSLASLRTPGPGLGEVGEDMARAFFVDWGVALRSMAIANVGHAAGREISDEQNQRLGSILQRIDLDGLEA